MLKMIGVIISFFRKDEFLLYFGPKWSWIFNRNENTNSTMQQDGLKCVKKT